MDLKKIFKLDYLSGNFGLETETLRVELNGSVSKGPHPFKNKWTNPYFQVDFAEAQLELVTPITHSYEEALSFLKKQTYIVNKVLSSEEYLLHYSLPLKYRPVEEIKLATAGISKKGRDAFNYRKNIMHKYSHKQQVLSSVHFNFSFTDEFLKDLSATKSLDMGAMKNHIYFKGYRQYMRHFPVITYLFGASTFLDDEYKKTIETHKNYKKILKNIRSYRASEYGYPVTGKSLVTANNFKDFREKLSILLNNKSLLSAGEIYQPIRMKTKFQNVVEYIEIRNLDLDPTTPLGIKLDTMKFMHLFMVFLMLAEFDDQEGVITDTEFEKLLELNNNIALGLETHLDLKFINTTLKKMERFYHESGNSQIHKFVANFTRHNPPISHKLHKKFNDIKAFTEKISQNKSDSFQKVNDDFEDHFKDMELSTQILLETALINGLNIKKIIPSENIICLQNPKNNHIEYIKQATKTSLNSEIGTILIQNKNLTKDILRQNNISVPKGKIFDSLEMAEKAIVQFSDNKIVVKPNDANYSTGVTVLNHPWSKSDYFKALKLAFQHSESILVESFIQGKEYRFIVIDDHVVGVLERRPAHVIGDGKLTIKGLIDVKNEHESRGKKYRKPLEKIKIDDIVLDNLKTQTFTLKSVLKEKEIAWLRFTSNVSSGGDTVGVTADTNLSYKSTAIRIARLLNLKIAGIDMIISGNYKAPGEYSILEVNDNPAIHIHHFPMEGKEVNVASEILKALKLI